MCLHLCLDPCWSSLEGLPTFSSSVSLSIPHSSVHVRSGSLGATIVRRPFLFCLLDDKSSACLGARSSEMVLTRLTRLHLNDNSARHSSILPAVHDRLARASCSAFNCGFGDYSD